MFVSAVQQCELAVKYIYIPSLLSFPPPRKLSQKAKLGSVLFTNSPLSVLHIIVYICQCYFLDIFKISRVTICSFDVLLSQFGASALFHVWF